MSNPFEKPPKKGKEVEEVAERFVKELEKKGFGKKPTPEEIERAKKAGQKREEAGL